MTLDTADLAAGSTAAYDERLRRAGKHGACSALETITDIELRNRDAKTGHALLLAAEILDEVTGPMADDPLSLWMLLVANEAKATWEVPR